MKRYFRNTCLLVLGLLSANLTTGCRVIKNTFAPLIYSDQVNVVENIVYKQSSENPKHRLDLFIPKENPSSYPVAIFIHGGFWKNQDKRYFRPFTGLYWNFGYALASRGFIVAVISYRLYPECQIDEQIGDVRSAVKWVQAHVDEYGGDASKIHLIGHSAGGHLAAMMGVENHPGIRSIIGLSPIIDTVHMKENQPEEFNREVVYPIFGTDNNALRGRSPAELWHSQATPMKIIVGTEDYPFVLEQARLFYSKAQSMNWQVALKTLNKFEHSDLVLSVTDDDSVIVMETLQFVQKY